MKIFSPDLVIEVTSVCNRSCSGCYAPNVVSNASAAELMDKQPGLFLDISKLQEGITFWDHPLPDLISIRGGEPSLHPDLPAIFKSLKYFGKMLVLETHSRWLLAENRESYSDLIEAVLEFGIVIKISFDSMHGLKAEQLKDITNLMEEKGIEYLIAVTEKNNKDYISTRQMAYWIETDRFIFQQKATSHNELIKPNIGVIGVDGQLKEGLKSKLTSSFNLKEAVG